MGNFHHIQLPLIIPTFSIFQQYQNLASIIALNNPDTVNNHSTSFRNAIFSFQF